MIYNYSQRFIANTHTYKDRINIVDPDDKNEDNGSGRWQWSALLDE